MTVKYICCERLTPIYDLCVDHATGTLEGDTSFEEFQDIDSFDYLDNADGTFIKIHDRTTGDVFWMVRTELDTFLIADELSDFN